MQPQAKECHPVLKPRQGLGQHPRALVLGAEKSPRPETHLMLRELGGTRTEKSGVTRPLPSQDPVMAQRSVNSVLGSKQAQPAPCAVLDSSGTFHTGERSLQAGSSCSSPSGGQD